MNKHKTNHDGKTNAKRNPLSLDCDYVHFCHVCVCKWAASSERKKKCLRTWINMNKMLRFSSSCACANYQPAPCSPSIHSVVSNLFAGSEWHDQTARMRRLIWALAVRIGPHVFEWRSQNVQDLTVPWRIACFWTACVYVQLGESMRRLYVQTYFEKTTYWTLNNRPFAAICLNGRVNCWH